MISAQSAPIIAPNARVGRKTPPVTPAVFEIIINSARTRKTRISRYQAVLPWKKDSTKACPVPRESARKNPTSAMQAKSAGKRIFADTFLSVA